MRGTIARCAASVQSGPRRFDIARCRGWETDLTHTFCLDCYRAYREREGLPPAEPPDS